VLARIDTTLGLSLLAGVILSASAALIAFAMLSARVSNSVRPMQTAVAPRITVRFDCDLSLCSLFVLEGRGHRPTEGGYMRGGRPPHRFCRAMERRDPVRAMVVARGPEWKENGCRVWHEISAETGPSWLLSGIFTIAGNWDCGLAADRQLHREPCQVWLCLFPADMGLVGGRWTCRGGRHV